MGLHSQLRATTGDHVHTRAQIRRHDRPACSRVRMGPGCDGPCTVGADQHQRVRGNALLYCGWPRLGSAGDALDQLDGASGQPQNLGRVDAPEPVPEGVPAPDIRTFR